MQHFMTTSVFGTVLKVTHVEGFKREQNYYQIFVAVHNQNLKRTVNLRLYGQAYNRFRNNYISKQINIVGFGVTALDQYLNIEKQYVSVNDTYKLTFTQPQYLETPYVYN